LNKDELTGRSGRLEKRMILKKYTGLKKNSCDESQCNQIKPESLLKKNKRNKNFIADHKIW